ncbi:MAG: NAD(P)-binding protein [Blastocatellia bacterium]
MGEQSNRKKKIAILGGGIGAMAAAFGMTERPNWQDEYEITVYQTGWRLGGKGASGRNQKYGNRIEEHGLHVWGGSYANGFRVMRKVYDQLGRDKHAPLATWDEAFRPHNFYTQMHQTADGKWMPWNVDYFSNDEAPGEGSIYLTPMDYVRLLIDSAVKMFESRSSHKIQPDKKESNFLLGAIELMDDLVRNPREKVIYTIQRLVNDLCEHSSEKRGKILSLIEAVMAWRFGFTESEFEADENARLVGQQMNLYYALARGIIADSIWDNGYSSIDHLEWRDWLRKHGAWEETLNSAMVRGTYDYMFAFARGHVTDGQIAAGACTHIMLRLLFTSKGSVFWKMQGGMGDVVFTPMYELLKRQGVKFKYFHRVTNLGVSADKQSIETIKISRQVNLKAQTNDPEAEYAPLVDVQGLPCWPSEPLYDQIVEGDELQAQRIDLESDWTSWKDTGGELMLRAGEDFDQVVLGISIGAFPYICPELIEADPKWRNMVERTLTVQTQAMQLWLRPDAAGLGWDYPPTILTAYVEPMDTMGDMSHLIPHETWPEDQTPGNIAYFCGPFEDAENIPAPFTDPDFPERERERVKQICLGWLKNDTKGIWPKAVYPHSAELDYQLLIDPDDKEGVDRFDSQYWRANVNATDRYVLSVPGSTQYRLAPGESGFDNLFLAGDWVKTPINAGCVEAAVMGGLMASQAMCGYPEEIFG